MSQIIVTAFSGGVISSPDRLEAQSNSNSTTLNAPFTHSCYLCWRHAEHIYHTTAWRNFPSEERPLCRLHWLLTLGVNLESKYIRAQVCEEAEAEEYEPYYSRADEMADLALADYYDEVARHA